MLAMQTLSFFDLLKNSLLYGIVPFFIILIPMIIRRLINLRHPKQPKETAIPVELERFDFSEVLEEDKQICPRCGGAMLSISSQKVSVCENPNCLFEIPTHG